MVSPIVAIEKLIGERLHPKGSTKMVVVDQSAPETFYFDIPVKPNFDDAELSEEQLELIAGGDRESAARTYKEAGNAFLAT